MMFGYCRGYEEGYRMGRFVGRLEVMTEWSRRVNKKAKAAIARSDEAAKARSSSSEGK